MAEAAVDLRGTTRPGHRIKPHSASLLSTGWARGGEVFTAYYSLEFLFSIKHRSNHIFVWPLSLPVSPPPNQAHASVHRRRPPPPELPGGASLQA